jgi:hypothetical protein
VLFENGWEIVHENRPIIFSHDGAGKNMVAWYKIKQENTIPEGEKVFGKPD